MDPDAEFYFKKKAVLDGASRGPRDPLAAVRPMAGSLILASSARRF
jgi:hypothetical protein